MKSRKKFSPRIEQLEGRLPLAGDVFATLIGGQLNVLGDGNAIS